MKTRRLLEAKQMIAQFSSPVCVGVTEGQIDGVVVVREVDGERQGVAVAVLLVKHRLVAVVPVHLMVIQLPFYAIDSFLPSNRLWHLAKKSSMLHGESLPRLG